MVRLYPGCCVVEYVSGVAPSWILSRLAHINALEPSQIYGFDSGATALTRTVALANSGGVVNFARDALREAISGPEARWLSRLTYETLAGKSERASPP